MNFHHHIHLDPEVAGLLRDINRKLGTILENQEKIMATLDETLAAVTAEDTKVDSIIALVDGLKKQLADALAGTTLPPETQAKVDAIFQQATASAGKIDTAITANTPPATP
jgi:Mg/Co/Ni transporter MgtE